MTRFATLIAATALVTIAAPSVAIAQTGGYETASSQVRFDDLNLSTRSGQASLDARIAGAVRTVCGVSSGRTTLKESQAQRDCASKARGEALAAAKTVQTGALAAK